MAGAPPVKVVSVAVTSTTPFSENESVEPVTVRFKLGAGGEGPRRVGGAQLRPVAIDQFEQHQLRVAVVPPVDAEIEILTTVLGSHRRTDPLATAELRGGELDLGELIAAEGLSGVDVTGVCAGLGADHGIIGDRQSPDGHVGPVRTEASVRPGEVVRDGAPRLGVPTGDGDVGDVARHGAGSVGDGAGLAGGIARHGDGVGGALVQQGAKVKVPLALMLRSFPPLFSRTTVPESPETVPPIE